MLFVAVETLITVAEHREVTAHTMACTHIYMREWAVVASTASLVEEVETKWRTFRRRVVG
jgi:hypothetical protein